MNPCSLVSGSVHPRGRGERERLIDIAERAHGSSPRARGTGHGSITRARLSRFIPAGAGNGSRKSSGRLRPTVHPRGRGERKNLLFDCWASIGSSPRARGTGQDHRAASGRFRFIPAGAGNGLGPSGELAWKTVHPRGRGERIAVDGLVAIPIGSSPRARGTVSRPGQPDLHRAVHPRGRGERLLSTLTADSPSGSSPRARGTGHDQFPRGARHRFIPAGAGNGPAGRLPAFTQAGSSPRARGTGAESLTCVSTLRFIPAGAGNGSNRTKFIGQHAVHPRGRGERT